MKTKLTISQIIESGHDEENAPRILALCQHLDCTPDSISRERYKHYGLALYSAPGGEYAVGTDEEAQSAAEDYIKDSVWAFRASFILSECGLPSELEEAIQAFQSDKCESANDALLALVEKCCTRDNRHSINGNDGLAAFAESAISADGRGHFLSPYDSEENEESIEMPEGDSLTYYIYRTN